MILKTLSQLLSVIIFSILLIACAGPGNVRPDVSSINDIDSNNILVMGKIKLNPPLGKDEQKDNILGGSEGVDEYYKMKIWVKLSETQLPPEEKMAENPSESDLYSEEMIVTKDNIFFYIKNPKKSFYMVNGKIMMGYNFDRQGVTLLEQERTKYY